MNVLDILQRFTQAVGMPVPTKGVGNPDDDVVQMIELLNQEGVALSRRHRWQALTFEATFTTVATDSQGTLASIIGASQEMRSIVNDTIWNRTTRLPVLGPMAPRNWQGYKALGYSTLWSQFRLRNNLLLFTPTPTAGQSCYFEYVSKCWLATAAFSTYYRYIAYNNSDTDVVLLDDELMLAGLEWRWLRKKGLSYAEEFASYETLVGDAMGRDGAKTSLNMDGGSVRSGPTMSVPVGSWPLP